MQLQLPTAGLGRYKSASQRARIGTESWGAENFFCPACESPHLNPLRPNTPASDFICPRCQERFQLKSSRTPFKSRIPDAAYSKMSEAIRRDRTPNIFALHYSTEWRVNNLTLIPRFAYSLKDILRRKPLRSTAIRHDWVGCEISLLAIPPRAIIPIILDGVSLSPQSVRQEFLRLRPFQTVRTEARGWTLDVLLIVESLGKTEFNLDEVYAHEAELRAKHRLNRHIRPKIRQQLQVLRDMGLVKFLGGGEYQLVRRKRNWKIETRKSPGQRLVVTGLGRFSSSSLETREFHQRAKS